MSAAIVTGYGLEGLVVAGGIAVLAREARRWKKRPAPAADLLPRWPGSVSDLLFFLLLVVLGGTTLPALAGAALAHVRLSAEQREVLAAAAFQLGLLAGVGVHRFFIARQKSGAGPDPRRDLLTGTATFLAAMPLVIALGAVWQAALEAGGLPIRKQDVLEMFQGIHSPTLRAAFIVLAAGIAPIAEECIFRAGLFRFFRGRTPRAVALLVPAALFGASHLIPSVSDGLAVLAPLTLLGVIFSLAYERTGLIGTAIVAHALFNLNTIVLTLLGVAT